MFEKSIMGIVGLLSRCCLKRINTCGLLVRQDLKLGIAEKDKIFCMASLCDEDKL